MTARVLEVSEAFDPRVADYVGLRDPDLRVKYEGERGVFIVEGVLAIRRLLSSDYQVLSFLMNAPLYDRLRDDLSALGGDAVVYVAPKAVLEEVTGYAIHRGVVAAVSRPGPRDVAAMLAVASAAKAPIAVLESVNDHENLGALFRNAAAFGVGAVLLDPMCSDPLYRRAVRVSIGQVLHVPFTRLSQWPDDLAMVSDAGYTVIAMTPAPDAVPLAVALADVDRPAFLFGAEGPGLSAGAMAAAPVRARIPMAEGADSLNVATAAALAFSCEWSRSRS